MERNREDKLKEIIGNVGCEVRRKSPELKSIAYIIDDIGSEGESIQRKLEEIKFLVFSPRSLSQAAEQNMQGWPEHSRKAYNSSKLPSRLMIVDPTQEEKSRLLATNMIGFYNETARNYNLFNNLNSAGKMIPAFEGVGKLDDLLAKVGFMVQKSDDGNTITVSGEGFTLTVDGPSGEIVDTPQQGKSGTGNKTSREIGRAHV